MVIGLGLDLSYLKQEAKQTMLTVTAAVGKLMLFLGILSENCFVPSLGNAFITVFTAGKLDCLL